MINHLLTPPTAQPPQGLNRVDTLDGPLFVEFPADALPLLDDTAGLCHDMACILIECHRDRALGGLFRAGVDAAALHQVAAAMARRLGPLIGGRYVPKVDHRAARDAAVWAAFTGRNHKEVMHTYQISRRLLYSILSRKRRGGTA